MTIASRLPAWARPKDMLDLTRLAVPVALSRASFMLMSLTDAVLLGRYAPGELPYVLNGWLPIGVFFGFGMGLLIAHSQFGVTGDFWWVITVYGIGQILESQILTPKIIGDRVGLHPLWMLFGMLAGAVLLGLVGVLLAVPLTAVIGVLVKFAVKRYLASGLYHA